MKSSEHHLKVGDAVWIATAMLHREEPTQGSFAVEQIKERVEALRLTHRKSESVYLHANQHCVANRRPNHAQLKMLVETSDGGRKLYRSGDPVHPERRGRVTPAIDDLPAEYKPLLTWYESWSRDAKQAEDPLLALIGCGKELWEGIDADIYIDELRAETT